MNFGETNSAGTVEKINANSIEVATGDGNLLITKIEFEENKIPVSKLIDLGLKVGSQFRSLWFIFASLFHPEWYRM